MLECKGFGSNDGTLAYLVSQRGFDRRGGNRWMEV